VSGVGWTKADAEELGHVLRNPAMRKAIERAIGEAMELDRLCGMDLLGPIGVGEAIRQQGRVLGMRRVVELFEDLSNVEMAE